MARRAVAGEDAAMTPAAAGAGAGSAGAGAGAGAGALGGLGSPVPAGPGQPNDGKDGQLKKVCTRLQRTLPLVHCHPIDSLRVPGPMLACIDDMHA